MFGLSESTVYYMCQHPVDMRKGINGLYKLVRSEMKMSPLTGSVFIFYGKNHQSVKLLRWDTDGFVLYQKRLEKGTFEMPAEVKDKLGGIQNRPDLLPDSELSEAASYFNNEWEAVVDIFKRGDTALDNNLVERMNRYFSMSRRSSLFFGSHKGAERAAVLYTLALSAKMNHLNIFDYLVDILDRTATWQPNTPLEKYRNLLPDCWQPSTED